MQRGALTPAGGIRSWRPESASDPEASGQNLLLNRRLLRLSSFYPLFEMKGLTGLAVFFYRKGRAIFLCAFFREDCFWLKPRILNMLCREFNFPDPLQLSFEMRFVFAQSCAILHGFALSGKKAFHNVIQGSIST